MESYETFLSVVVGSNTVPCHERGSCSRSGDVFMNSVEQRDFVENKRRGETYKAESSEEKDNRETLLLRVKSAYVSRFTEER